MLQFCLRGSPPSLQNGWLFFKSLREFLLIPSLADLFRKSVLSMGKNMEKGDGRCFLWEVTSYWSMMVEDLFKGAFSNTVIEKHYPLPWCSFPKDPSNPSFLRLPEVYQNPFSLGGERSCEVRPEVGTHWCYMVTWWTDGGWLVSVSKIHPNCLKKRSQFWIDKTFADR